MKSLEYLAKEDPMNYFAEPVDVSMVPGYRDVVRRQPTGLTDWLASALDSFIRSLVRSRCVAVWCCPSFSFSVSEFLRLDVRSLPAERAACSLAHIRHRCYVHALRESSCVPSSSSYLRVVGDGGSEIGPRPFT